MAPDEAKRLVWREAEADRPHQLWLHGNAAQSTLLLQFERSVELLWSPDSRAVAVTNHAGSNESDLLVYVLRDPIETIHVEERLVAAFGRSEALYANGHRYFRPVRWLDSSWLLFEVESHDAEPAVAYRADFRLSLDGQIQEIGR